MRFDGQTILVTGASRGIGRAIAEAFVERGARVLGTATSEGSFPADTSGIEFLVGDFSTPEGIESAAAQIASGPRLDALVNNAGINRILPLDKVSAVDFSDILTVDLRAPYRLCQAVVPQMAAHGSGRIVNIASIWSSVTKPHRTLYSTAKTGLVGMTRALAAELAPAGILVNAVSPGFVLTDLTRQSLSSEELNALSRQIPQGRMADPAEIARVVRFLCSAENTYLTGQNLVVDGGFTIV